MIKKQLRTYVKLLGKATLHMLFTRADLEVGPGGSAPPLPLSSGNFFSFVNVRRMVLRALLLKYIFSLTNIVNNLKKRICVRSLHF